MTRTDKPRIFYDTEFIEMRGSDWGTGQVSSAIELISIGMVGVSESGVVSTYYAVREDLPVSEVYHNKFLRDNVLPHLPMTEPAQGGTHVDRQNPSVKPQWVIRNEVREFIRALTPNEEDRNAIEMWADYAAYDHVVLAKLFGSMMDLPPFVPMFSHDIQVFRSLTNAPEEILKQASMGSEHHALNDAYQCKDRFDAIHAWTIDQLFNANSADPFAEPGEGGAWPS